MMKMPKPLKAIGKWLSASFAAVCMLCAAALGCTAIAKAAGNPLPTIFGWGNAVVLSGSMEPELPVGALLWIHRQSTYAIGDVVTYEENGTLVTHRLVSIAGDTVITRGDANNTDDSPIQTVQIRGKVSAVWPGAGNILLFLKSPLGMLLLVICGGLILFLPGRFGKEKKS